MPGPVESCGARIGKVEGDAPSIGPRRRSGVRCRTLMRTSCPGAPFPGAGRAGTHPRRPTGRSRSHASARTRRHRRSSPRAHALLVVNTEDEHLAAGTALSQRTQRVRSAVPRQGTLKDRHVGLQAARAVDRRCLVGRHHHRIEGVREQPANAFRETLARSTRHRNLDTEPLRFPPRIDRDASLHPVQYGYWAGVGGL